MESSQVKAGEQTNSMHGTNTSSKTEILSIKTSCPIASVSSQSLKSANNDVLFCCGTFEESNKNKLYFSKFNGDAGTLKAAIAVDHYLPPSKLMLVGLNFLGVSLLFSNILLVKLAMSAYYGPRRFFITIYLEYDPRFPAEYHPRLDGILFWFFCGNFLFAENFSNFFWNGFYFRPISGTRKFLS